MAKGKTLGSMGYVESFGGMPDSDSEQGDEIPHRYYGKYRGTVLQNTDFERHGRLQVQVPDVLGPMISTFAMPCVPFAGLQMGMYIVPPVGAGVWIEFEQGDPDYPIWTGFWWGSLPETPGGAQLTAPALPVVLLESLAKSGLLLSDTPVPPLLPKGGILLKAGANFIRIDPTGIAMFGALTQINGATAVKLNDTALVVMGPAGPPPV